MTPRLSILTPSVPSRLTYLAELVHEVERQVGELPVEHLVLLDNKRRSIGAKRQALLNAAIGDYVAFVDDDDRILPTYVESLLRAIEQRPDVVTFEQDAYFDGSHGRVIFRHGQANEDFQHGGITQRGAWHVCAWRLGIARLSHFPSINYGEDWAWAEPLNRLALKEIHIDKVLHEYHFRSEVTEAL